MFGKEHSEETRKRMNASRTGEANHFYGKEHSEESRAKMSASQAAIRAAKKAANPN
jgi:hypothetical protein